MWAKNKQFGFTIVELLIVIVVIAILAAISIVAYNGIQGRGRDAQRIQDISTIMKALEIYKTHNGDYPAAVGTANAGGWEVTTNGTSATNFLSALVSANGISKVPLDPVNKGDASGTTNSLNPNRASTINYMYYYYRYAAGANGCDISRGTYYVIGINRLDGVAAGQSSPSSPGFACTNYNWQNTGAWVTGRFSNG